MPTIISLFAGCGGSSLGYKLAGFRELLAIEWDGYAAKTFGLNFPEVPIWQKDIRTVNPKEILEFCGLRQGELDVLDSSPPCQGFSRIGTQDVGDIRNNLYLEVIRLINGLMPRVFIMENVDSLAQGKMKGLFVEMHTCLKKTGYRVRCKLINAMHYGVPQSRQRLIFIGIRSDLGTEPGFPIPSKEAITVIRAIGHLAGEGAKGNYTPTSIAAWHGIRPLESIRGKYKNIGAFQSVKLDPCKPSPTQTRAHLNWHWLVPRKLTIREAAILQSFPEDFIFPEPKTKAKEVIGNSVPPKMMQAIASNIRLNILERIPPRQ